MLYGILLTITHMMYSIPILDLLMIDTRLVTKFSYDLIKRNDNLENPNYISVYNYVYIFREVANNSHVTLSL